MDVLTRIKRLIVSNRYRFTDKATDELQNDGLVFEDALESILNAQVIKKTLRAKGSNRRHCRESLYVIESRNYSGTLIYTKGKIDQEHGQPIFYIFISSKRSVLSG